ncbi:hypothetical protein [Nocardioides daeguensis]|uniref:Secreted protein n=1 Tax=Nocardioides daeguensis TaxID=908359 RepID=A0ABP6UYB2_9ACTN|nr:hypothetical protein [Nocardioides daeguensis]MBV6725893.1 hypothetical protein [Nocardioides daeguensis]MCR1772592.1 hypothetical protein [Nocardioides daeguensis]
MHRALFKMFLGLAVALGLTFTTASVASATPVAAAAQAAPNCTTQQTTYNSANGNYNAANAYVAAADAKVKKLKKKLKKAKKHHAPVKKVKKLKKKLKKAKKARAAGIAYRDQAAAQRNSATVALTTCWRQSAPTSTASPIQSLCDAIPELQPVCDALGNLPGVGGAGASFDTLCTAVPQMQPLCDAISGGGLTDPAQLAGLVDILKSTLTSLGLGAVVDALAPVLDLVDTLLGLLAGGIPSGDLPSLPGLPGLPTGSDNPLCAILPLPGVC